MQKFQKILLMVAVMVAGTTLIQLASLVPVYAAVNRGPHLMAAQEHSSLRVKAEHEQPAFNNSRGLMRENVVYMQKKPKHVPQYLRQGAEKGNAEAQMILGLIGLGVSLNDEQSHKWIEKAAVQGYADAQVVLGLIYVNGMGISPDHVQAFTWFLKAAEQGNSSAEFFLGVMYNVGKGVPKDINLAMSWYHKAALQGHTRAKHKIAFICLEQGRANCNNSRLTGLVAHKIE